MPRVTYYADPKRLDPGPDLHKAADILKEHLEDNKGHTLGVTTLIGNIDSKNNLVAAAVDALQSGRDIRKIWDAGKDLGSMAHLLIENWLADLEKKDLFSGIKGPDALDLTQVEYNQWTASSIRCLSGFKEFWALQNFAQWRSEFSMVHDGLRIGGTPDLIADEAGVGTVLLDVKTKDFRDLEGNPKKPYLSWSLAAQLGMYAHMVQHGRPNRNHEHEDPASLWWLGTEVQKAYVFLVSRTTAEHEVLEVTREQLDLGFALCTFGRCVQKAQYRLGESFKKDRSGFIEHEESDLDQIFKWAEENNEAGKKGDEHDGTSIDW